MKPRLELSVEPHRLRRAVLLALAADGVLTAMDAVIKSLTPRYPALQIAGLRFAFGFPFAAAFWLWSGAPWPSAASVRANSIRSLTIAVAASTFFYALGQLPLAEVAALTFLAPLFIALLGAWLLGEELHARIGIALAIGFVGMLVMVGGQISMAHMTGPALAGTVAALVSAAAYAINVVILRSRARQDPLPTIMVFQNLGPGVLLAIPAMLVWVPPTGADLLLFAAIGAIGVTGHYLLIRAFTMAPAATLAPVEYTVLVWAALFGLVFFDEVPGIATLAGAILIALSTWVTHR